MTSRKIFFFVLFISLMIEISPAWSATVKERAKMEKEAVKLFRKGKPDEGLTVLKQLTETNPDYANGHMNYGSMLFTKGQFLYQTGKEAEAEPLFHEAEQSLTKAIQLFGEDDKKVKGQCYYLLGDIYAYVYRNHKKAA